MARARPQRDAFAGLDAWAISPLAIPVTERWKSRTETSCHSP